MRRKAVLRSEPQAAAVAEYQPGLEEYCEIVLDYSLSGLAYLRDIPERVRTRAVRRLHLTNIEDDEWRIREKFKKAANRKPPEFGFLPMPKPGGNEIEVGFFVPRFRYLPKAKFVCDYCLLLWREMPNSGSGKVAAFRLETPDQGAHSYSHVQLSRSVRNPDFDCDLPKWMPDSYPAFPLVSESPVGMFLATATALHGYDRNDATTYVAGMLRKAMAQGASAARGARLVSELNRMWPRS
jgi:hypothetical protein